MVELTEKAKNIQDQLINWRRELHKIPEVGLETPKTRKFIETELDKMGIEYKSGYAKNGVVALIKKDKNNYDDYPTFAIRTDIDALEIQEETGLDFSSEHDGKMHACGHDAHTAMALGAAKIISENIDQFAGNVKIIFQPGEEGAGGGEQMVKDGALKDPDVGAIVGIHIGGIFDEVKTGQIGIGTGPIMACIDKFQMKVIGEGGHGAMPNVGVDPIAISASIIENIQTLISREISPVKPGVISVCKLHGGTAFNVIPGEVEMEGTARFIDENERQRISKRMEELCRKIAESRNAELEFEYEYGYPPVVNPPEFTGFCKEIVKDTLGNEVVVDLKEPVMGGEDMAYYLQEVPGAFLFLGSRKKVDGKFYGHHNSKFDIDESVFWMGTAIFLRTAHEWLDKKN